MRNRDLPYFVGAALAIVIALVLAIFVAGGGARALESEIGLQRQQMTSLQNQIVTRQTELKQQQTVTSVDVQSFDASRVEKDDVLVGEVFARMTTWNGREAYEALREQVKDAYHLMDGDRFLEAVLPRYASKLAQAGREDVTLETPASGAFAGIRSRVCDVSGDMYSYFTVVSTDVTVESATVRVNLVACYTTDSLGNVSSLSGYVLA